MKTLESEFFADHSCDISTNYNLNDYEADAPRWCKGCGDFSILSTVQRIFRDNQVDPHNVVCVSGIGCSSRFPYYLKTYGFHGIHGRALPISTGVSISRPDLHVLTVMGDGDCFSIGAGHWLHAIRYNLRLTVLVFDNEIYALTKKQASPTTKVGTPTNTSPRGAYLKALNPLSVILGISNVSFLAQTATWLPAHLNKTIEAAWEHDGLSFVRILQRCPIFSSQAFEQHDHSSVPLKFLNHKDGIEVHKSLLRMGELIEHDQHDLDAAQALVHRGNNPGGTEVIGLVYKNSDIPVYNDIRADAVAPVDPDEKLAKLDRVLDDFTI